MMRVEIPNGRTPPDCVYRYEDPISHLMRRTSLECGTDLLDTSNMPCNVLDRNRIFDSEAIRLTLHPRFVDQNASICCEAYRRTRSVSAVV